MPLFCFIFVKLVSLLSKVSLFLLYYLLRTVKNMVQPGAASRLSKQTECEAAERRLFSTFFYCDQSSSVAETNNKLPQALARTTKKAQVLCILDLLLYSNSTSTDLIGWRYDADTQIRGGARNRCVLDANPAPRAPLRDFLGCCCYLLSIG